MIIMNYDSYIKIYWSYISIILYLGMLYIIFKLMQQSNIEKFYMICILFLIVIIITIMISYLSYYEYELSLVF